MVKLRHIKQYESLYYDDNLRQKQKKISETLSNMFDINIKFYANEYYSKDDSIYNFILEFDRGYYFDEIEKSVEAGKALVELFEIDKRDILLRDSKFKTIILAKDFEKILDKFNDLTDSEELGLL